MGGLVSAGGAPDSDGDRVFDDEEEFFGTSPLESDSDLDGCGDFFDVKFVDCDGSGLFGRLSGTPLSCGAEFGEPALRVPSTFLSETVAPGTVVRVEGRGYVPSRADGEGGASSGAGRDEACATAPGEGCWLGLQVDGHEESFAVDAFEHRVDVSSLALPEDAHEHLHGTRVWRVETRFLRLSDGLEVAHALGYFATGAECVSSCFGRGATWPPVGTAPACAL